MDKRPYVVRNCYMDNCIVVNLTEEQYKAINWFIDWCDVDALIGTPENESEDI